jgi:hypothetical protein
VLSCNVVSHHPTPDIGSRCPWTPKHVSNSSVPPHLYTMPHFHLRLSFTNRAELGGWYQTWSAHDHQYKRLGRHAGVGVKHAKPIRTRLV